MPDGLVTRLLPVLGRSLDLGFNVFDVMHHGLHEKQISNVFAWLLDEEGTHRFGSRFLEMFVDEINGELQKIKRKGGEINQELGSRSDLPVDRYAVLQEVNTALPGAPLDIADIVLQSKSSSIVVENYFMSDGHNHDYWGYLRHGRRDDRRGEVVLLCRDRDEALQTQGWQNAPVVTYARLVGRLLGELGADRTYQRKNPEAYAFVEQMHRKFVTGRGRMEEQDVLGFVVAMCESGEAGRYQNQPHAVAADQFANALAEQARHRFGEGRELLRIAKSRLQNFAAGPLTEHLNETFGAGFVREVNIGYTGIYQWTVNFVLDEAPVQFDEERLQIKFGPSAWFSNDQDPEWTNTEDDADYAHLFITRARERRIVQSEVTLQEVLDGLDSEDRRLHDEIVQVIGHRER